MSDRCCCGHITEWIEPILLGNILHEKLGDYGAFCGPMQSHELRDCHAEITRLRCQVDFLTRVLAEIRDLPVERTDETEVIVTRALAATEPKP